MESVLRPARRLGPRGILSVAGLIILMAVLGVATWHWVSPRSSPLNHLYRGERLPAVPRRQRPSTLPPELFSGQAARAYRFAIERPDLLEQIPCYCGCYFTQGHQNLLDCFQDRHAEMCEICQAIALRAADLAKAGYGIEDIKSVIDKEFAQQGK